MLNTSELVQLRDANPISLDEARHLAEALELYSRVLMPSAEGDERRHTAAPLTFAPRTNRPVRRRALVSVLVAVAFVVAIMVATPAWAFFREMLSFGDQPKAPRSVQLQFWSLNLGAPAGMSPRAVSGETRKVGQFIFGGATHSLWVAPAKNGGFCALWIPGGGGGCSTAGQPVSTGAVLVFPHDADQPARTATRRSQVPILQRVGVPEWITGAALSVTVSDVVVRFSDGSAVHPRVVWVSAPINAGFFAYDVPKDEQSSKHHVRAVEAYDREGALVRYQTFTDPPTR
jgi:hypothetical protein